MATVLLCVYACVPWFRSQKIPTFDRLGKGGYGIVKLCTLPDCGDKTFAMKRIKIPDDNCEQLQKDIANEILVAARVGYHERIMKYHRFLEIGSKFVILMDVMKESLSKYLRNHYPLHEQDIIRLSRQIVEGLKYLHDNKVLHRDLKGQNVLLDEQGSVKLTDFGISKCLSIVTGQAGGANTKGMGTCNWTAPEVLNPDEEAQYGLHADIWSIGATMVEMITGKPPYPNLGLGQVAIKIFTTKKIEYEFPNTLSRGLEELVNSCLKPEPKDRPNCDALLQNQIFQ